MELIIHILSIHACQHIYISNKIYHGEFGFIAALILEDLLYFLLSFLLIPAILSVFQVKDPEGTPHFTHGVVSKLLNCLLLFLHFLIVVTECMICRLLEGFINRGSIIDMSTFQMKRIMLVIISVAIRDCSDTLMGGLLGIPVDCLNIITIKKLSTQI